MVYHLAVQRISKVVLEEKKKNQAQNGCVKSLKKLDNILRSSVFHSLAILPLFQYFGQEFSIGLSIVCSVVWRLIVKMQK